MTSSTGHYNAHLVICFCLQITHNSPKLLLPFSCQSISLWLGDKVFQLSVWLFGACIDWHVPLQLQKSASQFPRDTTCLAQGTFVRSIFISLLFSQPISPGHSVRRYLSLTVKLSVVCVCERAMRICVSVWNSMHVTCPKDNPWSSWQQNELWRLMFSHHRSVSLQLPWLICWITVTEC